MKYKTYLNKLKDGLKSIKSFALLSFIVTLFPLPAYSQESTFARVNVVRAYADGKDISRMSIENEHCFQFYNQGGDIMFANNYIKANSKSYGRIFNIEYRSLCEKSYSMSEVFHFKWNWKNSSDNENGTADVYIKIATGKEGTAARVVIVSGDLENILDYAGVFNGSLDKIKK